MNKQNANSHEYLKQDDTLFCLMASDIGQHEGLTQSSMLMKNKVFKRILLKNTNKVHQNGQHSSRLIKSYNTRKSTLSETKDEVCSILLNNNLLQAPWTSCHGAIFRLNFIDQSNLDASLRLKAGQELECSFSPTHIDQTLFNTENGSLLIDYKVVRQCLIFASANEKSESLEAMRSIITSKSLNMALNTVHDIIHSDLFAIYRVWEEDTLLKDLLWPRNVITPHPLQTSIAKLLNTLVSYPSGREYFNNKSIIELLLWDDFERNNIEQEMAENLIAVMTKLSFNHFQSADMIKKGLLMWLVHHMAEVEYSASKYHLECMTGLLRMLLSVENCIDFALIEVKNVLLLLASYLDIDNDIVKKNIFASMLALFKNPEVVKIAKEMNFVKRIGKHIKLPERKSLQSRENHSLQPPENQPLPGSQSSKQRTSQSSTQRASLLSTQRTSQSSKQRKSQSLKQSGSQSLLVPTSSNSLSVEKNKLAAEENDETSVTDINLMKKNRKIRVSKEEDLNTDLDSNESVNQKCRLARSLKVTKKGLTLLELKRQKADGKHLQMHFENDDDDGDDDDEDEEQVVKTGKKKASKKSTGKKRNEITGTLDNALQDQYIGGHDQNAAHHDQNVAHHDQADNEFQDQLVIDHVDNAAGDQFVTNQLDDALHTDNKENILVNADVEGTPRVIFEESGQIDKTAKKTLKKKSSSYKNRKPGSIPVETYMQAVHKLLTQSDKKKKPHNYAKLDTRLSENEPYLDGKIELSDKTGVDLNPDEKIMIARFFEKLSKLECNVNFHTPMLSRILVDAASSTLEGNRTFPMLNFSCVEILERTCIRFFEKGSPKSGPHHSDSHTNEITLPLRKVFQGQPRKQTEWTNLSECRKTTEELRAEKVNKEWSNSKALSGEKGQERKESVETDQERDNIINESSRSPMGSAELAESQALQPQGNEASQSQGNEALQSQGNEALQSQGNEASQSQGNEASQSQGNEASHSSQLPGSQSMASTEVQGNGASQLPGQSLQSQGNEASQLPGSQSMGSTEVQGNGADNEASQLPGSKSLPHQGNETSQQLEGSQSLKLSVRSHTSQLQESHPLQLQGNKASQLAGSQSMKLPVRSQSSQLPGTQSLQLQGNEALHESHSLQLQGNQTLQPQESSPLQLPECPPLLATQSQPLQLPESQSLQLPGIHSVQLSTSQSLELPESQSLEVQVSHTQQPQGSSTLQLAGSKSLKLPVRSQSSELRSTRSLQLHEIENFGINDIDKVDGETDTISLGELAKNLKLTKKGMEHLLAREFEKLPFENEERSLTEQPANAPQGRIEDNILKVTGNSNKTNKERSNDRNLLPATSMGESKPGANISFNIDALLNNEELVDLFCDKMLEKIAARNDFCGPNCGSKCGGLNRAKLPLKESDENAENVKFHTIFDPQDIVMSQLKC